jgi:hypothetical protein
MSVLKVLPMCVPAALPGPLLHNCVEEREITEICKKLGCARNGSVANAEI